MKNTSSLFSVLLAALVMISANPVSTRDIYQESLEKFKIPNLSKSRLDEIALKYEITRRLGDGFEVLVKSENVESFLKLVPQASRLDFAQQGVPPGYKTLQEVETLIQEIATKHPTIAKLSKFGKSASGRDLYVLKISDNVLNDENEPELMLTGATHGDEQNTTEILLRLITELVQGNGKDPRLSRMIADNELFFIPVVNADGYARVQRYENGIDPNRNFPWPESPEIESKGSTKAIIEFFNTRDIVGSIDYHSAGKMTMYPWAYTRSLIEETDRVKLDLLTKVMSEQNRYAFGPISKVIYVAKGSSADYYYWKKRTFAVAVEIGNEGHAPPFGSLTRQTDETREPLWKFIESF